MGQDESKAPTQLEPISTRLLSWVPADLRTGRALGAVLLLTVVTSAFWEWLAKPGLGRFGRLLLTVVTLGSETFRDAAYQSAALDPYPVSASAILAGLTAIPIAMALASGPSKAKVERELADLDLQHQTLRRWLLNTQDELAAQTDAQDVRNKKLLVFDQEHEQRTSSVKDRAEKSGKRLWRARAVLFAYGVYASGGSAAIAQAVLIRRVFVANVAICAPHMSATKRDELMSRFATMTKRSEYQAIEKELRGISDAAGLRLRSERLW